MFGGSGVVHRGCGERDFEPGTEMLRKRVVDIDIVPY